MRSGDRLCMWQYDSRGKGSWVYLINKFQELSCQVGSAFLHRAARDRPRVRRASRENKYVHIRAAQTSCVTRSHPRSRLAQTGLPRPAARRHGDHAGRGWYGVDIGSADVKRAAPPRDCGARVKPIKSNQAKSNRKTYVETKEALGKCKYQSNQCIHFKPSKITSI